MNPQEFYRTYIEAARRSERDHGVPALFALAQSALETGWGRHAPGHMMFGIKAGSSWRGKKQLLATREVFADGNQGHRFPEVIAIAPRAGGGFDYKVKDWFRAYDSPLESFADHARLLRGNRRYARCFETGPNGVRGDPREFARRTAAAGYATDPGYAASLIEIVGTLERIERLAEKPSPFGGEGAGSETPRVRDRANDGEPASEEAENGIAPPRPYPSPPAPRPQGERGAARKLLRPFGHSQFARLAGFVLELFRRKR